jgi:hypothetical protein
MGEFDIQGKAVGGGGVSGLNTNKNANNSSNNKAGNNNYVSSTNAT